jgi:hypothetical protein
MGQPRRAYPGGSASTNGESFLSNSHKGHMTQAAKLGLLLLLLSQASWGTSGQECPLGANLNGQETTLHGRVWRTAHNVVVRPDACSDVVVLAFAGDWDSAVGADRLQRDKNLKRFQKYLFAVRKHSGPGLCLECYLYDVDATLSGRLDASDRVGFRTSLDGSRVTGFDGFGLPMPFSAYRLTIVRVRDVRPIRLGQDKSQDAAARRGPAIPPSPNPAQSPASNPSN